MPAIFGHPRQLNIPTVRERETVMTKVRELGLGVNFCLKSQIQLCINQNHAIEVEITKTSSKFSATGHRTRASGHEATRRH